MQVAIACRHGSITDEIRDYITRKSEKLVTYFERITAVGVMVDFDNDHIRVEILVDAEHKHDFVAQDVGDDVVSAFDRALHKTEQQIRKYKAKIQDHRRDRPIGQLAESELDDERAPD